MKIVFASNYINHHERFLCDALYALKDIEFIFIQTIPIRQERVLLGWQDYSDLPYCLCSYCSEQTYRESIDICNNADVLIFGGAPYEFVKRRVKNNKLTFFYAERLFRDGLWHMLYPPTFLTVLKRFIIPGMKSNFYMLCASGYTALDCYRIFAFRRRYFRWGHFIEVKQLNSIETLFEAKRQMNQNIVSILWAGRLIGLKHAEYAISVAERLEQQGYMFKLNIIGAGEMETSLRKEVKEKNLSRKVHFLGSMKPQEVRTYMEASDIFLFTSGFKEGWGAVLGEAMASGCAVVTSHGIGATPFLASHMENALIYETGDIESLYRNVKLLMDSENLRATLSRNAISTMEHYWNAKVGAERLYWVAKSLMENNSIPEYDKGPMSKAPLINNNWFKDDKV